MTSFEQGDIVVVGFPQVERNVRKRRPALVVSADPGGPSDLLIWVMMITGASRPRWPGDVPFDNDPATNLPIMSMVRTAKMAAVEAEDARQTGRLPASAMRLVRERLRLTLAI